MRTWTRFGLEEDSMERPAAKDSWSKMLMLVLLEPLELFRLLELFGVVDESGDVKVSGVAGC